MRPKQAKRERQSEQLGRGHGLIGPFKYTGRDAWLYKWEALDEEAIEYARGLIRAHRTQPTTDWPDEIKAAVVALVTLDIDPRAMPFLRHLRART